ncbi:cytochrome P450 [Amylostereum chailletii]|nr:cytochrome P450 [Amylostereum chailletii]
MSSLLSLAPSGLVAETSVCIFLLLFACMFRFTRRERIIFPPGPKPLPFVGNLPHLPKVEAWLKHMQWAREYGDITSFKVFNTVIIVINSTRVAKDLFEKRGTIYSDRPNVPFFDLFGFCDWNLVGSSMTAEWHKRRKLCDYGLRPGAIKQYQPMQMSRIHAFLRKVLSEPADFVKHVRDLEGGILLSMAYGYDIKDDLCPLVRIAEALDKLVNTNGQPGALLVNTLPILRYLPEWIPGMGFKAEARRCLAMSEEMINRPFQYVKRGMRVGNAAPSFTLNCLEGQQYQGSQEELEQAVSGLSATLYAAGIDTSVSTMNGVFLFMARYPDIQRKARTELDLVVGRDRLPAYKDRVRLPYVNAVCMEIFRFKTVVPLGVPHATTADDIYEGFFIPKGSIVMANQWAMLHDPDLYPEPDTFKPERFITNEGSLKVEPNLSVGFGLGKRICPGRHLVDSTFWIFVASVLSVFEISDVNATTKEKDVGYTDGGIVIHPDPFVCQITPRDSRAEALILEV